MCGLFGIIFHGKETLKRDRALLEVSLLFSNLAVMASQRGTDATGLARIDADGYGTIYKNAESSTRVVKYRRWWRILGNISPATLAIMGHTRWGTHGSNTWQNAHPFDFTGSKRRIIGMHNGIIRNHLLFGPKQPYKNDSANLFYGLANAEKWSAELRRVQGSMALTLATEGRVHLVRNWGSPCELAYAPDLHATVYASTASILEFGAQHSGVKLETIRRLPVDELWSFLPGQERPEIERLHPASYPSFAQFGLGQYSGLTKKERKALKKAWKRSTSKGGDTVWARCHECKELRPWNELTLDADETHYICEECASIMAEYDICGTCGKDALVTQMEYDEEADAFVCRECCKETDSKPDIEEDFSQVICGFCNKEFATEQVNDKIFWHDSVRSFICVECYQDPECVFAPS